MSDPERSSFSFTATRPVAIIMVVLAAVVFGLVGLSRLPVNLLPDISYPTVTVRTSYPGASPQDVEERISERIQESVSVISGVRRVVSISRPEVSDVILEFEWGTTMVFAVSDIRERLDRVFLPDEADRPLVLRYDPSLDPVMTLGLSADKSLVELGLIAEEEIERELSQVEGVAAVKIRGDDEEEVRIALDEEALSFYGLDPSELVRRLAAENVNAAAGSIEEGKTEYLVRAMGEFQTLAEIENVILERRGDVSIRLSQVAEVRRVPADKAVISLVDGKPSVLIDIYKEADANIVELCQNVKDRVYGTSRQREFVAAGKHEEPLPGDPDHEDFDPEKVLDEDGREKVRSKRYDALVKRDQRTRYLVFELAPLAITIDTLQDQSRFISNSVNDVLESAVKGGFFAILIIYLFLRRFSPTAIIAVSIPISLVATFAPMLMSDIDLNIMSLGGLALGVGMLVDNSIVVLESIARAREEGMTARDAGVVGVSRVASAVTASTLTTVAVFFPIVFVEGVAGQLFRDQALTVVYSLLVSLLVALFVIPMLATRGRVADAGADSARPVFGKAPRMPGNNHPVTVALLLPVWALNLVAWLSKGLAGLLLVSALWMAALLVRLLGWLLRIIVWPFAAVFDRLYNAIDRTYPVLIRAALQNRAPVIMVAAGLLVLTVWRIPALGSETLPEVHQGEIFLDAFLPRDATVERTNAVLAPIEQRIAALPEVSQTFLASGVDKEELNDSDEGEHSARLLVRMTPTADRRSQEERVRAAIREVVRDTPEIQSYRFERPSILSFAAPMIVEVLGQDLVALRQVCAEVQQALSAIPGLRDVRSTLQRGNPELAIKLDRDKLAALGLEPDKVTDVLRAKILGEVPTRFTERERKIDIRVRMDREKIGNLQSLLQINVNPDGRPTVPLLSVAEVQRMEGPSEIRRIGNLRGAEVQAALVGFDLGTIQSRVVEALAELSLPRGIEVRLGGQKDDLEQSRNSLTLALLLAVFLVYIVMASQFESLVQPLVILVSLPFALIGVVGVLDFLDIPLSVVVFLGAIVLAGIVVNNAIILLDQINRQRAAGIAKAEAIVRGAQTRLRPVLMTTLTTVLGLLPLTGWLGAIPLLGGSSEGIELRAPMAITVITGLITSTLLTLVVVPVIYSMSDRRA